MVRKLVDDLLVTSPDEIEIPEPNERESYPQHECGLFGVFGHPNAAVLTYYGLFALQHRGQESAGIVTSNGAGQTFLQHKGMGLVSQVLDRKSTRLNSSHSQISYAVFCLKKKKKKKKIYVLHK